MTIADVMAAFAAAAIARQRLAASHARFVRACNARRTILALLLAPAVALRHSRATQLEAAAERLLQLAIGQR